MTPEETSLRDKINEASKLRRHKDLAAHWCELLELCRSSGTNSFHDDDYAFCIEALCRTHAWDRAEEVGSLARAGFCESAIVEYAHAMTAFQRCDWETAVERFEIFRRRHDPAHCSDAYRTIFWQMVAYGEMFEYQRLRAFAKATWPWLRTRAPMFHDALHLMHIWLGAENASDFRAWASPCIPEPQRKAFEDRIIAAAAAHSETANTAIVSLGQSCLPFVIALRWGLLSGVTDKAKSMPFDLTGALENASSRLVDNAFSDFLDAEVLIETPFSNIPMLTNTKHSIIFFHEKGAYWKGQNWERLHRIYEQRIHNFRALSAQSTPVVYVFCLAGKGDPQAVIDMYLSILDSPRSKLLLINVTSEPASASCHARITVLNHAFPEDYSWNAPSDYNSHVGFEYETTIVEAIIDCMPKLSEKGLTA